MTIKFWYLAEQVPGLGLCSYELGCVKISLGLSTHGSHLLVCYVPFNLMYWQQM